ncbi:MAG: type 4a pilus biogenesis protein PilO [Bacteroidetes bacterium]|nr:type 4a pilus biogenesis protein PilO [Bacteroidota bacterium]
MKLGIDIDNISRFKKGLLIVLPSLAILAFFITLFILPALEENAGLEAEIARQKNEINLLHIHSAKLPNLIAENEKLQQRVAELQRQLPEEKEVSDLLKQVSLLGIKSGLHVITWRPKTRIVHASKEVYEIPVDVEMRGSFHDFGQFFSSLTKLGRIVNLNDINIKTNAQKTAKPKTPKAQQELRGLQVNFITITYSLIPEHEKKQLEEKEKAEKKK